MNINPRTVAGIVLSCGLIIGTVTSGSSPARAPFQVGGYQVLAADFHVHSFPGDGGMPPWTQRDEARRAGLDVFAVTNHNQTLTGRLAQRVAGGSGGTIVIAGEEVTNSGYHLIAVGISARVSPGQTAAHAIAAIHAQGGVAIAAHPGESFHGWTDEAVAMLDGAEVAHPSMDEKEEWRQQLMAFQERGRRLNPHLAPIGSSDVHMSNTLGICRTFLFVREASAAGVLDAIRKGLTVAMDSHGRLYGRPELTQLLDVQKPSGRVDARPAVRRASLGLTVCGLVGVLLLGRNRDRSPTR